MTKLHQFTEGFQAGAQEYQRGRPGYPKAAIDFLTQTFKISSYTKVVDVAAGTGKFTQGLVKYTQAYISAVEPLMNMREEFRKVLPQTPVMEGTAENLPFEDHTVDLVTVAEGFHWFDRPKAMKEIHRVLKRHGGFAMIWNNRDRREDWVEKLSLLIDKYYKNHPYEKDIDWKKEFDKSKLFEPLKKQEFSNIVTYTQDMLVDRVCSTSTIAMLPPEEKNIIIEQVKDLTASHPSLKGKETFPFPYTVEIYWTHTL